MVFKLSLEGISGALPQLLGLEAEMSSHVVQVGQVQPPALLAAEELLTDVGLSWPESPGGVSFRCCEEGRQGHGEGLGSCGALQPA